MDAALACDDCKQTRACAAVLLTKQRHEQLLLRPLPLWAVGAGGSSMGVARAPVIYCESYDGLCRTRTPPSPPEPC